MITVRASFKTQPQYKLVFSDMVYQDPCGPLHADVYIDAATGILYYSSDGIEFFPADGIWCDYWYYDWGTDLYYWNLWSISGAEYNSVGTISSPCGVG